MKSIRPFILISIGAALLFIPFLGNVQLFDWDEINFAESAREMLVTGNYTRVMIDFQPFWEKPPLFFWLQAASMKLFGVNEFAARFPNAICGILTLCLIFYLGRKYFDDTFGRLWVLAYVGSILPHFYFKSGIIDPWFNLFIFSGIFMLMNANENRNSSVKYFSWSGLFIGLAILTKGPVALLITLLAIIVFSISKNARWITLKSSVAFFATMIFISSLWFGFEIIQNGTGFIRDFIVYQKELFSTGVAGHGGPFYYHAVVLLLGCFPASFIALNGFFRKYDAAEKQIDFRRWMIILFVVVLVLFSIVKTKIIHYSSLCYLPLTFLAAWEIYFRQKNKLRISNLVIGLLLFTGILFGAAASLLPYFGKRTELITPYIKDSFAVANLEALVDWHPAMMLIGLTYIILFSAGIFSLRRNFRTGIITLFIATMLFIQACLLLFVPRIERYSQGAAIDFYKTLQGKDIYIEVLGFKSYAHLFYSRKQPQENPMSYDKNWLLHGEIDKPAYFVTKITKANEYESLPQLIEIDRKNGFVFFKREPAD